MFETTLLDSLPMWGVFLGSVVLIVIAVEIGYSLGRRKLARVKNGESHHIGGAVAATLGLLAFMLAFTFGSGTTRLDTKRQLVLDETNTIATAYLRADLLAEPYKPEAQRLIVKYIDHRFNAIEEQNALKKNSLQSNFIKLLETNIAEAKAIHAEMWAVAVAAAQQTPGPMTGLFVSALNELFDLHQQRVTVAVQQRMPMVFWFALYCLATLAMGLAGYDSGVAGSGRNMAGWVVAISFSTVIVLVVGLDRPQVSSVGQLPLQELQQDIHAAQQRQ